MDLNFSRRQFIGLAICVAGTGWVRREDWIQLQIAGGTIPEIKIFLRFICCFCVISHNYRY